MSKERMPSPENERNESATQSADTRNEKSREARQEDKNEDAKRSEQVELVRRRIRRPKHSPSPDPKRIEAYIEKHVPDYLRNAAGQPTLSSKLFGAVMRLKDALTRTRIEGREGIPSGASLVVSNHSGGEAGALLSAFRDHPLRIAAGATLNWSRSPFRAWLLKKFGMLPVQETLSNLNDEERDALLERVPGKTRKDAYRQIAERDRHGVMIPNIDFLHQTLACLLRGDKVAVFPEGLFLYDGTRKLRKAYEGLEIIAQKYKELTGNDLPIIPVGISTKHVGIGEAVTIPDDTGEDTPTDWVMRHVAAQLPPEERGVYGSE